MDYLGATIGSRSILRLFDGMDLLSSGYIKISDLTHRVFPPSEVMREGDRDRSIRSRDGEREREVAPVRFRYSTAAEHANAMPAIFRRRPDLVDEIKKQLLKMNPNIRSVIHLVSLRLILFVFYSDQRALFVAMPVMRWQSSSRRRTRLSLVDWRRRRS